MQMDEGVDIVEGELGVTKLVWCMYGGLIVF